MLTRLRLAETAKCRPPTRTALLRLARLPSTPCSGRLLFHYSRKAAPVGVGEAMRKEGQENRPCIARTGRHGWEIVLPPKMTIDLRSSADHCGALAVAEAEGMRRE